MLPGEAMVGELPRVPSPKQGSKIDVVFTGDVAIVDVPASWSFVQVSVL